MKKFIYIVLMLFCIGFITGCGTTMTKDVSKFKEEYEGLNGKKTENGKTYRTIKFDDDINVVYEDASQIVERLKNGSGVIYLGFPECPWCRTMLPVLLNVLEEDNRTLYYFNAKEIRDSKHLDENHNVITDKEGTKEYKEMLELLNDYLGPYEGLEDESIKRIYLPTVIFVENGEIKGVHIGTVDSQEDPYKSLTESQEEELEESYESYLEKLGNETCSREGC